jgi:hypothetical protein
MAGNSGSTSRGCGTAAHGRKSHQAGPAAIDRGPEPRIVAVLYTFLSADGRLAPSGLRRFILPSQSSPRSHTRCRLMFP